MRFNVCGAALLAPCHLRNNWPCECSWKATSAILKASAEVLKVLFCLVRMREKGYKHKEDPMSVNESVNGKEN